MNLEALTLYGSLQDSIKNLKNNTAIYYQGTKITFRKFGKLLDRTADILQNRLGIKENDVVLVAQPNIPDVLLLIYALNKIGAIVNLVHPFTPFNQIKAIMKQTKTKVAILFEQRVAKEVDRYRDLADKIYVTRVEDYLPCFKKFVYHTFMNRKIRYKLGKWRGKFDGFKYWHDLKPTGKPVVEKKGTVNDISVLLHSGSTTGDPKTICLCDRNFNFIANRGHEIVCGTAEDFKKKVFLSVLPSFHGFGFCMTMHCALSLGSGVALVPKYSAEECNKVIRKNKVFVFCGVPTMFENLLKNEKFVNNKHLKHVRLCFCGGDTMSISLKERFDAVLRKNGSDGQIFEGYGLTESVAAIVVNRFDHNKPGSLGYPLKDVEFRIVDENGKVLPPNEVGEITIKSGATMVEYFNNPEATKAAVRDGWLYTGDLGHLDEDGYLFFDQRKKRVVKVSGVGVFPTEVERLVQSVPGVEAVCAIEIPDAKLQHALKLFVVAKYFDEEGMRESIMDTCRKYLIRWSVPKEIEFVKELPLTMLNKVDFRKLQEEENARRGIK